MVVLAAALRSRSRAWDNCLKRGSVIAREACLVGGRTLRQGDSVGHGRGEPLRIEYPTVASPLPARRPMIAVGALVAVLGRIARIGTGRRCRCVQWPGVQFAKAGTGGRQIRPDVARSHAPMRSIWYVSCPQQWRETTECARVVGASSPGGETHEGEQRPALRMLRGTWNSEAKLALPTMLSWPGRACALGGAGTSGGKALRYARRL